MTESLSEHLRNLRTKSELSVRSAAARAGVSPTLLSHVESGHRRPTRDFLEAVAVVYGADLDLLLAQAGEIPADIEDAIRERVKEDPMFFRTMRAALKKSK